MNRRSFLPRVLFLPVACCLLPVVFLHAQQSIRAPRIADGLLRVKEDHGQ